MGPGLLALRPGVAPAGGASALLPYLVSIMVFQALSLVAAIMLRVICRWTMPTLADLAVPAALLWMNVWYPGPASPSS